jgi:hypothetical protein
MSAGRAGVASVDGRAWARGPVGIRLSRSVSGADAGQGREQAAATQLVAELRGQAVPLLPPQATQMAEKHQGPQRDRQADQQLQAELEHSGGEAVASRT